MTDDEMLVGLITEMQDKPALTSTIPAAAVFQLVGIVQLATRSPLPDSVRTTAETFIALATKYFQECPTVLHAIALGNDPANDRLCEVRVRGRKAANGEATSN